MSDRASGGPGREGPAAGPPGWDAFLRALMHTLDAHLGQEDRALLLRAIGARLAATTPLPGMATLEALERGMNERLAETNWGQVAVAIDLRGPGLVLTHRDPPRLEGGWEEGWVAPLLAGLHGAWLSAQPGAEEIVPLRILSASDEAVVLRYGE